MKKLNLGCGFQKKPKSEGWINLDMREEVKPDILADITEGMPMIPDGDIDEVESICMLEQIEMNDKFRFTMNEIWRVLKPGGKFYFIVPNADYSCAYQDPFDVRFFNEQSWNYFDMNHHCYKEYGYGLKPWTHIVYNTSEHGIMNVTMHKPN